MKEIFLLKYAVAGIKCLENPVVLDFYKKRLTAHGIQLTIN